MKARHVLLIAGLLALVLGFVLAGGDGRDGDAGDVALAADESEATPPSVELEPVELPQPASEEAPQAARAALPVEFAEGTAASELAPGESKIVVEVVSLDTGEPIQGLRLTLIPEDDSESWSSTHVEGSLAHANESPHTDDEGRATFLVAAERDWGLSTERGQGIESTWRDVTSPPAGELLVLRIELHTEADQDFYGQVVDAATGTALPGATATFEDGRVEAAVADGTGVFRLPMQSWDRGAIRVECEGYAWQVIDAQKEHATSEKALVVRLSRSATLVARVERMDGALSGLSVRVSADGFWMRPRGTTFAFNTSTNPTWEQELDGAGVACLVDLPPNVPLTVDVFAGRERLKRLPELKLEVGEERELVIRVGGGCRLVGTAHEADGTPAEGLEIWLLAGDERSGPPGSRYFDSYESDELADRVRVDASGGFVFEDVAPGPWLVGPGGADDPGPNAAAAVAHALEISDEDVQREVALTIHYGLTIAGRVVGPDGENVDYAYVMDTWGRADENSRDGNFTLGPLAPGEYEIVALPGGTGGFARSAPVKARAGDEDVLIEVSHGATITVVVHGVDGEPISASVHLIPGDEDNAGFGMRSTSGSSGSYRFDGLKAGTYHVKASDAFDNIGVLRNLVVDENTELEEQLLHMQPGARVSVRVRNQDDERNLFWRVFQDGMSVGFPGQSAPIVVMPGPVTVEFLEFDRETREKTVLETRQLEALLGQELEVDFDAGELE